jgi:hypothetical protein
MLHTLNKERYFWEAYCDTSHYLVIGNVRYTLSGSKEAARSFNVDRLDLKKLSEVEGTEQPVLQLWRNKGEEINRTLGDTMRISDSQLQITKDNMNGSSINMV